MPTGALLLMLAALAPLPPPPGPIAHATYVPQGPDVDGDLADPVWQAATPITDFTQRWPDQAHAPSQHTEVRILYDDHALYFAFHCFDTDPSQIVHRLTRRDLDATSDAVIIDLDTRGDHVRAFHFEVTAGGVRRDAIRTGDWAVNYDWDAVWRSDVRLTADGWTAELAIPFTAIRYDANAHTPWRMQLKRYITRRNETDQWVFIPLDQREEMLRYGVLDGLDRLPHTLGIDLAPFVGGRLRSQWSSPAAGAPNGFEDAGTAGLDATVALTSGLTLRLSVLPDFGQVEADPALLNLSTFEVHLDEKRPFFLEAADLFQLKDAWSNTLNDQLFYSRRLGTASPSPILSLPTGSTIVAQDDVIPIWVAAKVVGRIADKLTVAVMDGITAADSAVVRLPNGSIINEGVVPLTNFLVGRLQAPVGGGFSIGATATSVNRNEPGGTIGYQGTCLDGDPAAPNGRCTRDEQTAGLDLVWQPKGATYAAVAQLIGSHISAGPTRELLDGTLLGAGSNGYGARLQVAKLSGQIYGTFTADALSPQLDTNEMGYLQQQDFLDAGLSLGWRKYDFGGLNYQGVSGGIWQDASWKGLFLGRGGWIGERTTFKNQWGFNFGNGVSQQAFDEREAWDGTPVQRPGSWSGWGSFNSDGTKPYYGSLWVNAHTNWKGWGESGGVSVTGHLLNQWEFSLSPSVSWNSGDPRHVDTVDNSGGSNIYLFGLQDAFTFNTVLRSTYTINPNISFQAYSQLFFSAVRYNVLYQNLPSPDLLLSNLTQIPGDPHDYDSRAAVLNISLVFRWEYLPGSVLYLVYTHEQNGGLLPMQIAADGSVLPAKSFDTKALNIAPTEDVFLIKLSYDWQR